MTGTLEGKVALISGSSRGVGLAVAHSMAERGADVVLTARGEGRLEDARHSLESSGANVETVAGDVGTFSDAERMVAAALDRFGRLDVLVNNAGISMRGDFAVLDPDVARQVLSTNLSGSIYLTRACMDPLIASRGSVVFVSSIAGLLGLPGASVYSASKAALGRFAESLRIELTGTGVHVGVVYLGFTEHDPDKRILAADGSLVRSERPAHHTQEFVAERIVRLVARRRRQVVLSPIGKLGWVVHRLSPRLYEGAVVAAKAANLGVYEKFS